MSGIGLTLLTEQGPRVVFRLRVCTHELGYEGNGLKWFLRHRDRDVGTEDDNVEVRVEVERQGT